MCGPGTVVLRLFAFSSVTLRPAKISNGMETRARTRDDFRQLEPQCRGASRYSIR